MIARSGLIFPDLGPEVRVKVRFFRSFKMNAETGCWQYTGQVNKRGYGVINNAGRVTGVHRYAYLLFHKADPGPLFVCHRCDNPGCVNPAHLFLGTHKENMEDMTRKKRQRIGSERTQAKLTEQDIVAIRSSDKTRGELAKEFNVCRSSIEQIISGLSWKFMDDGRGKIVKKNAGMKLTQEDVDAIRASPLRLKEASEKWGVAQSMISRIRNGVRWSK